MEQVDNKDITQVVHLEHNLGELQVHQDLFCQAKVDRVITQLGNKDHGVLVVHKAMESVGNRVLKV